MDEYEATRLAESFVWEQAGAVDRDQWAIGATGKHNNLVTILVASWLMAIQVGNKIGFW